MPTTDPTEITAKPDSCELTFTRTLSATPERVFQAYVDSEQIKQWWGPHASTLRVEEHDPRVGGTWRFVCVEPDGEYAFRGVYHEVTEAERIVQTFEYLGAPGFVVLESMEFEAVNGGTKVVNHSVFQSVEARQGALDSGMESGARESFERLAALVEA